MTVMAEVVVLPVVRIGGGERRAMRRRPKVLPDMVTDLNAFRYARERALVERREMGSLLPEDGGGECG